MVYILFGLWFLMAIMGQEFVEKSIVGPINPFFILLGVSLSYFIFYKIMCKKQKVEFYYDVDLMKMFKSFKLFIAIEMIYVLISYLNIPSLFGIRGLPFNSSYIIRHSYFIYGFAISACVFYSLKHNNIFKKMNRKYLYLLLFIAIVVNFITKSNIIYQPMIMMLSSYIYITKKNLKNLLLFIIIVLISQNGMMSYMVASFLLIMIIVTKNFSKIFNNILFKFFLLIFVVFFVSLVIFNYDYVIEVFSKDANTIWRWRVWTNEFRNLYKTLFLGVGYGTAYVDYNIFHEVSNYNMYLVNYEVSVNKLLTVGNHNSFVNIIYRSGIIGIVMFIKALINLFKVYYKTYKKNNTILMRFGLANFVFNLFIVALNPGFESPHFYTGFIFSLGVLVYIIYTSRKEGEINE